MGHVETLRCSHRWLTKPRFYWIWSKGTVRVRAQLKEKRILAQVKKPSHYVYLSTVYSCGLRRQEGLKLTVADIDSDRKLLAIRQSKGAKDRYVPLPQATLELLRSIGNSIGIQRCYFPVDLRQSRVGDLCKSRRKPAVSKDQ